MDLPYAQLVFVGFFSYVLGTIYNLIMYPKEECFIIPNKLSYKCGVAVVSNTIAYSYAIHFTNFPVVMMVRSCNLLSVTLVGVLFTGVKDTSLKLGTRKIVIALIVTIGIIIFKVFDPNQKEDDHKTQLLGIFLILISMVAEGFLPDFQAVIKERTRPHPTVLLAECNKWTFILSFIYTVVTGHFMTIASFLWHHKSLFYDMLMVGVVSFTGQVFIYRLVKQFKQHIVPFIITTRKIFTVALSIFYFGHLVNLPQVVGILIVLFAAVYEFVSEIRKDMGSNKVPKEV